jgi:hypothetical protein
LHFENGFTICIFHWNEMLSSPLPEGFRSWRAIQRFPESRMLITPQAKKSGAGAPPRLGGRCSVGASPSVPASAKADPAKNEIPFSTLPSGKPVYQIVLIPG